MRGFGPFLRDAWRLTKPYFRSEERWIAWGLLGGAIALNLLLVAINVILNYWNRDIYNTLQEKDWRGFIALIFWWQRSETGFMPGFVILAAIYIPVAIYRTYLRQWLEIRWRRWLTSHIVDDWLADHAYYRISLTADPRSAGTDNPDQRIGDDIRDFIEDTLTLGLSLLSNVVNLISFLSILWTLSGVVTLLGIAIPGYMVWVALLYSILGTWITHLVGRPLAFLNFQRQRVEADFRFALVRLRENTEGVALQGGEDEERQRLSQRFTGVVTNWWGIMRRTKMLNGLVAGYGQVAGIFPLVVAAPRYFGGEIALGQLMQTAGAFGEVQGGLSWAVDAYGSLARWQSEVTRLTTFLARAANGAGAIRQGHRVGSQPERKLGGTRPDASAPGRFDPARRCRADVPEGTGNGHQWTVRLGQEHLVPRSRRHLAVRVGHGAAAARHRVVPAPAALYPAGHAPHAVTYPGGL